MYFVYILKNHTNSVLYKGMTNNLERRLSQHNHGQCNSTKKLLPLELVYVEVFENRIEARVREKYFKSGIGREEIKEMLELIK